MDSNGVGLDDVIGDGIGRLHIDGRPRQGLGNMDDGFNELWGAEPGDIETMESNPDE